MPYQSNSDLPESVRSRYSDHCQSVFRNVWNSIYEDTHNESRAFAGANSKANECEGKKSMNPTFKIFAPMLKASMGADGRMRLHGVASSTVKDRHGDTMTPSALADMERAANNNLTIFLNHEYRVPEDVAGHVERALIRNAPSDPDIHDLTLDIVINDTNERAVKAWQAIDSGTQLGLSIGAMIPDGGATRDRINNAYQIEHVELLETSLVGVPANPRSWVDYAVKSLNGIPQMIEADLGEEITIVGDGPIMAPEVVEVGEDGPETIVKAEEEPPEESFEEEAEEEHLEATVGHTETTEPDITDATVSIETPFANISIDTGNRGPKSPAGSSQDALESNPENEDEDEEKPKPNPWAAIGLSGEPETEDVVTALRVLEPTVVTSLRTSSELLKAIVSEQIALKAALEQAVSERDAAIAATEQVMARMVEILNRLSETPMGRRAVVKQASDEFAGLRSVYGEEFITLLKKG